MVHRVIFLMLDSVDLVLGIITQYNEFHNVLFSTLISTDLAFLDQILLVLSLFTLPSSG